MANVASNLWLLLVKAVGTIKRAEEWGGLHLRRRSPPPSILRVFSTDVWWRSGSSALTFSGARIMWNFPFAAKSDGWVSTRGKLEPGNMEISCRQELERMIGDKRIDRRTKSAREYVCQKMMQSGQKRKGGTDHGLRSSESVIFPLVSTLSICYLCD
jgi:hypothetical protein